jgi:hypothetical protein
MQIASLKMVSRSGNAKTLNFGLLQKSDENKIPMEEKKAREMWVG